MLRVIRLHQIVIAGILGGLEWGRSDYGHGASEVLWAIKRDGGEMGSGKIRGKWIVIKCYLYVEAMMQSVVISRHLLYYFLGSGTLAIAKS